MGVARCKGSRKGRCPTCSLSALGRRCKRSESACLRARARAFVRWFSPRRPKKRPGAHARTRTCRQRLGMQYISTAGSRVHSHLHDAGGHSIRLSLHTVRGYTHRKGRVRRGPYTGPPRGLAVATTRRPASAPAGPQIALPYPPRLTWPVNGRRRPTRLGFPCEPRSGPGWGRASCRS